MLGIKIRFSFLRCLKLKISFSISNPRCLELRIEDLNEFENVLIPKQIIFLIQNYMLNIEMFIFFLFQSGSWDKKFK